MWRKKYIFWRTAYRYGRQTEFQEFKEFSVICVSDIIYLCMYVCMVIISESLRPESCGSFTFPLYLLPRTCMYSQLCEWGCMPVSICNQTRSSDIYTYICKHIYISLKIYIYTPTYMHTHICLTNAMLIGRARGPAQIHKTQTQTQKTTMTHTQYCVK